GSSCGGLGVLAGANCIEERAALVVGDVHRTRVRQVLLVDNAQRFLRIVQARTRTHPPSKRVRPAPTGACARPPVGACRGVGVDSYSCPAFRCCCVLYWFLRYLLRTRPNTPTTRHPRARTASALGRKPAPPCR